MFYRWKSHLPDGRIAEFRFVRVSCRVFYCIYAFFLKKTRYDSECEVTIVEQGYAPVVRKGGWRYVH